MENYPPNNPPYISHTSQYTENNQGYIFHNPIQTFQNAEIPSFDHPMNNFDNQNHPFNMNPTLPNSFPLFGPLGNEGHLAPNTGNISSSLLDPPNPEIYFGSTDFYQEQSLQNMSLNHDLPNNMFYPASQNSLQGFALGSTGFDLEGTGPNMSQTFPNLGNPVSAIGSSEAGGSNSAPQSQTFQNLGNPVSTIGSTEAGGSNSAPQRRGRGRPPGSKGKAKVEHRATEDRATEDLSIEPMVLEVPPGVDLILYLIEYVQSRQISLTVMGGFGSVSKIGFKYSDSQPLVFIEETMTMMSMSGTYLYSSGGPSSSQSFFNVMVAGQNSKIYNGKAYQVITAGITKLTVAALPQIAQD